MPALDQKATMVSKAGTAGFTLAISFGTLPAVGSLIVVPISFWFNRTGPLNHYTSVTDNQGNGTYSVLSQASGTGLNCESHLAYAIATNSSGTFTITFTFNVDTGGGADTDAYFWMGALSFTGVLGTIDQSATNTAGLASTSLSATTGTTTTASELVVTHIHPTASDTNLNIADSTATYTIPAGYTQNDSTVVTGFGFGYKTVSSTGTQNCNWGFDAASAAGVIATFASSGGLTVNPGSGTFTGTQSVLNRGILTRSFIQGT